MRTRHYFTRAVAVSLILLLPTGMALAKDEENVAQVYLEFDPETGELKAATDQDAQAMNHAQAQELQQRQDAELSSQSDASSNVAGVTMVAAFVLVLVLLSGILAWKRRNPRGAS